MPILSTGGLSLALEKKVLSSLKVCMVVLALLFTLHTIWKYSKLGCDFSQDLFAARQLREGLSIYDGQNDHPPLNAYLALPFSYLPATPAVLLFNLLSLAAVSVLCRIVAVELNLSWGWAILAVTLFSYQTQAAFALVSVSPIVALLLLLVWRSLRNERYGTAGIFWALATMLKLYPAYLALYFLCLRRWRTLFVGLTALFVIGLFISLDMGSSIFPKYFLDVAPKNFRAFADFHSNLSIAGLCVRIFGSDGRWAVPLFSLPWLSLPIAVVLIAMLTANTVLSIREASASASDFIYCIFLIMMFLCSPLAWGHYLLWLPLPIALLIEHYRLHPKPAMLLQLLFIYACLNLFPLAFGAWQLAAGLDAEFFRAIPTLGLLFLLWMLMKESAAFPKRSTGDGKS